MAEESYIDPTAVVSAGVQVGRFCIIEAGAWIGKNVVVEDFSIIQSGAKVGARTKVGTHCKVGANATIGEDCSFTAYCEIRSDSVVGDRVLMGSRCTLSSGTIVGNDVIIKYGFVATDTANLDHNDVKQPCVLKDGSHYGANVTIMPTLTVGVGSEIGSCSQVRHDVPDGQTWYGSPAKFYRDKS